MTIAAIETLYAGCRFRSRLEARWAVFFDALAIRWQYEPQGYETSAGQRYLPDFLLPEVGTFVEIKAVLTHADLWRMLQVLPSLRPGEKQPPSLLILGPVPEPGTAWQHARLTSGGSGPALRLTFFDRLADRVALTQIDQEVPVSFVPDPALSRHDQLDEWIATLTEVSWSPRLLALAEIDGAYAAARSARFEFGRQR